MAPETNESQDVRSTQKTNVEKIPGATMLPLARIKRIIKEDKDVALINAEATFCIAYATELFMEYLVKEAFEKAKRDKRKTVYYRDLANTVKEVESFEFLEDVIPTTMTLKQAMDKRKETMDEEKLAAAEAEAESSNGNSSKHEPPAKKQRLVANEKEDDDEEEEDEDEEEEDEKEGDQGQEEEEEEEAEEEEEKAFGLAGSDGQDEVLINDSNTY